MFNQYSKGPYQELENICELIALHLCRLFKSNKCDRKEIIYQQERTRFLLWAEGKPNYRCSRCVALRGGDPESAAPVRFFRLLLRWYVCPHTVLFSSPVFKPRVMPCIGAVLCSQCAHLGAHAHGGRLTKRWKHGFNIHRLVSTQDTPGFAQKRLGDFGPSVRASRTGPGRCPDALTIPVR